ncbi:hypothetical protein EMCRGX_G032690 [Ephydatia muelleri]
MVSNDTCTKVRTVKKRYTKRTKSIGNKELQKMEKQQEYEEALRQIRAVYPQCSKCFYHYKSQKLLDKHNCGGEQQCAIDRASHIGTGEEVVFATFEPNFYSGWA